MCAFARYGMMLLREAIIRTGKMHDGENNDDSIVGACLKEEVRVWHYVARG